MQNTNQSVWMNALIYYGLAAHICSPWSKLRALTVWAGSSVKCTFHSEQSDSCCFIAYRNQLTKHMHKGNSGHNLSHQKVIFSQTCCQHNRAFFLFSYHRITVSDLKKLLEDQFSVTHTHAGFSDPFTKLDSSH